jgi:hypothetical protein
LLTAWSTAGILGPVVVNYMHDTRLEAGVPFDQIYGPIFIALAGLMAVGFAANFFVKPVADKYYMTDVELADVRKQAHEGSASAIVKDIDAKSMSNASMVLFLVWALVLVPISYGVWSTVQKAWTLFH